MRILTLVILALMLMSNECYEPYYEPYSQYKPILMDRDEMENSIAYTSAKEMLEPGKIYLKGDTIFINEKYKGIHIIDNSNPSSPKNVGFIIIPGCIDMAMKEDILFADNSVDLIALRLSANISQMQITKRIRNTFPELTPPDNRMMQSQYLPENRPDNTLIVGWEKIENEY